MRTSGAGGLQPREACGRTVSQCRRQLSRMISASRGLWKISPSSSASRSRALKLSTHPFSQGGPDAMKAVFEPTALIQSRTAWAMISGPLSERMWLGTPREA